MTTCLPPPETYAGPAGRRPGPLNTATARPPAGPARPPPRNPAPGAAPAARNLGPRSGALQAISARKSARSLTARSYRRLHRLDADPQRKPARPGESPGLVDLGARLADGVAADHGAPVVVRGHHAGV